MNELKKEIQSLVKKSDFDYVFSKDQNKILHDLDSNFDTEWYENGDPFDDRGFCPDDEFCYTLWKKWSSEDNKVFIGCKTIHRFECGDIDEGMVWESKGLEELADDEFVEKLAEFLRSNKYDKFGNVFDQDGNEIASSIDYEPYFIDDEVLSDDDDVELAVYDWNAGEDWKGHDKKGYSHCVSFTDEQNKILTELDGGPEDEDLEFNSYEIYCSDGYIQFNGYADRNPEGYSEEFRNKVREFLITNKYDDEGNVIK